MALSVPSANTTEKQKKQKKQKTKPDRPTKDVTLRRAEMKKRIH